MKRNRWAFIISLWGRSAFNALESYENDVIKNSSIDLLIYETEPSGAVIKAKELGIKTLQMVRLDGESRNDYQKRIIDELVKNNIDYVFLMGYNHVIRKQMLDKFPNRIINIHPSLLPSFKGINAIGQALSYGVKVSGITTHIIDENIDEGVILFQEPILLMEGDTFESLDARFVEIGKKIVVDTINFLSK